MSRAAAAVQPAVSTAVPVAEKWNWTRKEALAVLGWAPTLFDLFVRQKAITGRPHGRNGATIYSREQLLDVDRKRRAAETPANDLDGEL